MPTYSIQAPDGKTYKIDGPEGATDDQVRMEVMRQNPHLGGAQEAAAAPATPTAEPAEQPATMGERILGSRPGRLALGASSILTGPFQLAANAGDEVADDTFGPEGFRLGDWTNEQMARIEAMKRRGQKANGQGEFDAMGLLGSLGTGAAASKGIPIAKTMITKMAQGGGLGALFGLAAPVSDGKQDADYWGTKGVQAGVGGFLGTVAPPVITGLSKGAAYVKHLTDRFTDKGIRSIADREWMQHAGDEQSQQALIKALKAPNVLVQGSNPKASQVLADMPEGRPIIAVEKALSTMTTAPKGKTAPTVEFKRLDKAQEAARIDAKKARDAVTDPMREDALEAANKTTSKFKELGERIVDRFYSKANALQTKGQFDTLGAQMDNRGSNWSPVAGQPRAPKRYAPHTDVMKQAASASDDTAPIIAQRQRELAAAESELAALQASGAEPLQQQGLVAKIASLRDRPGNFSDDVIRKTMDSVIGKLNASVEKFGRLDADELYKIRKNLGLDIAASMGENAKPNKAFNAMLERDIQLAFDEAIESAGGVGWKNYLAEYSKRSAAIRSDVDRSKAAKKVATEVTMGAFDNFTDQAGTGLPGLLNTNVALANAFIRGAGKRAIPKVAGKMTEDAIKPQKLAEALERQIAIKGRNAAISEFTSKYGRGAVQQALAVQMGKE